MTKNNRSKKRLPIPLAPPKAMRSRKRARVVTTLFHKYTKQKQEAIQRNDTSTANEMDEKIQSIGGREEYQRASQLNTSLHSTSKWVLKVLARKKLLTGIITHDDDDAKSDDDDRRRRPLNLLEVGAINTELIDASKSKRLSKHLSVRAIDLRSSHENIEQVDFFDLEYIHENVMERYDAVVCSMVLNCVPTGLDRGRMLTKMYNHLRPGGILFLTIPKLCLTQSKYIDEDRLKRLLVSSKGGGGGVGFEIDEEECKHSPKVAFFVLKRPLLLLDDDDSKKKEDEEVRNHSKWTKLVTIRKGKKYRNEFSVLLSE